MGECGVQDALHMLGHETVAVPFGSTTWLPDTYAPDLKNGRVKNFRSAFTEENISLCLFIMPQATKGMRTRTYHVHRRQAQGHVPCIQEGFRTGR